MKLRGVGDKVIALGSQPWQFCRGLYTASQIVAAYDCTGLTLASALVDITGNGNDRTVGLIPGHTAGDGVVYNGVNQYLVTPVTPLSTNWTLVLKCHDATTGGNTFACGCYDVTGNKFFLVSPDFVGSGRIYGNGAYVQVAPPVTSGVLGVAGNQGYLNGAPDGAAIGAGTVPAYAIFTGCLNNAGVAAYHMALTESSLLIANTPLSATAMGYLATDMP